MFTITFIVLETDYVDRLLTTSDMDTFKSYREKGMPLVKFPLPLVDGCDDEYINIKESYVSQLKGDHRDWGEYDRDVDDEFVTDGCFIHDFLLLNHEKSPYMVSFVKEQMWDTKKGTFKEETFFMDSEPSKNIRELAESVPCGCVVFQRKDKRNMCIAEYIPLFRAMNINYCAFFDGFPSWSGFINDDPTPYSIDIIPFRESHCLIVTWDTESG